MPSPSVALIDALNSLLEAEVGSIFHFVGEDSPYLGEATPHVRQELQEIRRHLEQHEQELASLIRRLGSEPAHPPGPDADEQYLAFLSLKFLLPKLVEAKQLMIERYDHVLGSINGDEAARKILQRHMEEMRTDLQVLMKLTGEVLRHN